MNPVSYGLKRNLLLWFTALVVSWVRNVIQYGSYSWNSLWEFLSFWVAHWLAVVIVMAIALGCIKGTERFFLGCKEGEGLTVDKGLVYISMVILVSAVFIFFMAHYTPYGDPWGG